ncbi:MAG: uroporphyrinogen-III C-methyltransferase [Dehalococcoidia bacterium]|nr:MAG: uroporphyrinogen-III C-methyltransferase [Dehalococcoidia bacterium]
MKPGMVYLVGAGPGDPGLITQKALDCLARAEVIVYDHLLDRQLLEAANPQAERIYVGKSGAKHALEQAEINRLLVDKARESKLVVRLKGGDPFVFGRGGEEAEMLAASRIPFEVVPGVSSAVAVPAYAGIPVTHRGLASSFAVITGHEDPGKTNSSINWEKLATGVDTLVFLMGVQNLGGIVAKLLEFGRAPETPVAVIKDGTYSNQLTIVGQLYNIEREVRRRKLTPPAVVVVGQVVQLREKLGWFEARPLKGMRVMVTRARRQASMLSRLLAERGAVPVELPAIDIKPVSDTTEIDRAIQNAAEYQWLVFTSSNGVEAFFQRLHALRLDGRALAGLRIAVIGPATAAALSGNGISADYCPTVFTNEALLDGFRGLGIGGQHLLLPRADIADRALSDGLAALGAIVHEVVAYRTTPAVETAEETSRLLAAGEIDLVTFTSSSTVNNLMAALDGVAGKLAGMKVACIGPKTAATARAAGLTVDIEAAEQTMPGLVQSIEDYFRKET